MAPKTITLTYFNARGIAEPIRWVLAQAGVDYEDKRIEREEWPELKPCTPTGQLPMLTADGVKLGQSGAIANYLGKQFCLCGSNDIEAAQCHAAWDCMSDLTSEVLRIMFCQDEKEKENKIKEYKEKTLPNMLNVFKKMMCGRDWLVGNKVSIADLYLASFFSDSRAPIDVLASVPEVEALVKRVQALPNIKAWMEKRPKTDY